MHLIQFVNFVSGTTECLRSNQANDYLRTKPQSRRLGRSSWLFIIKNIEFVQMKNKAWPDGLKAVIFFFLTLSYCLLTVSLSLIGPYWTFTRPSWHLITDGLTNLLLLIRLLWQKKGQIDHIIFKPIPNALHIISGKLWLYMHLWKLSVHVLQDFRLI